LADRPKGEACLFLAFSSSIFLVGSAALTSDLKAFHESRLGSRLSVWRFKRLSRRECEGGDLSLYILRLGLSEF